MRIALSSIVLFLVICANSQNPFVHVTSTSNVSGNVTTIDHSSLNGRQDLVLIVTQHYGKYNNHQVGVWYNNGKWTIYNEDRASMPIGTKFNVLALNRGSNAYVHTAQAGNMEKTWTILDHPKLNNNSEAMVFVTQNWKGVYNPKALGVWYTGSKWSVFNQDNSPIPSGTKFNVVIMDKGFNSGIQATAEIQRSTAASKQNQWGPYLMKSPLTDPNAMIFITQNWKTKGPYNNHIPAVWWGGSCWTIYNQDQKA